jgi:hypothetical protein
MSNFKKDVLTVSRVMFALKNADIDTGNINLGDISSYVNVMSALNDEKLAEEIFGLITTDNSADSLKTINMYFIYLMEQSLFFTKEISRRVEHAKKMEVYKEDTEEEIEVKRLEHKDDYPSDYYMSCFMILAKNGIDASNLCVGESLIMMENILCEEMNKSTMELLGYVSIKDNGKSFAENIKKIIKYANFYAFALDIYNGVSEMYDRLEKKEK